MVWVPDRQVSRDLNRVRTRPHTPPPVHTIWQGVQCFQDDLPRWAVVAGLWGRPPDRGGHALINRSTALPAELVECGGE